jgi:hypothetical protein
VIDLPKFSYCESTTASSLSPVHIRELTSVGRKLGGGIDTPSFCGLVEPSGIWNNKLQGRSCPFGGWDLPLEITLENAAQFASFSRDRPGRLCPHCHRALLHKLFGK